MSTRKNQMDRLGNRTSAGRYFEGQATTSIPVREWVFAGKAAGLTAQEIADKSGGKLNRKAVLWILQKYRKDSGK